MTANHRALDEADLALIERVKQTPSLYDPRNPNFRLTYCKQSDWEQVAAALGLGANETRRRWTCLRDRYSRELKQLRMHPEKDEFGKNSFFRQMDFLRRFVRKRRERRRNTLYQYDSSWAGSIEDLKNTGKLFQSDNEVQFEDGTQNPVETKMQVAKTEDFQPFPEGMDKCSGCPTAEVAYEFKCDQAMAKGEDASLVLSGSESLALTLPASPTVTGNEQQPTPPPTDAAHETEDDFFCKSIAMYLRQLSRLHKIKAKVEMFQILEKYIDLEENSPSSSAQQHYNSV